MKKELLFYTNFHSFWYDGKNYYRREEYGSDKGWYTAVEREVVMKSAELHKTEGFVLEAEAKLGAGE